MLDRKFKFVLKNTTGVEIAAGAITLEVTRHTQATIVRNSNASGLITLTNAAPIANNAYGDIGETQTYPDAASNFTGNLLVTTTGTPNGNAELFYHQSSDTIWPDNGGGRSVKTVTINAAGTKRDSVSFS